MPIHGNSSQLPHWHGKRATRKERKIVERQAVQGVVGPKKAGGDGTGSDDRGMKSAGDETIVERGTPQLNVQELRQEQQLMLHEHETQEAFSEHEEETQGALSELMEETQEAFLEHEQGQQQKKGEAGPASGSANLEGPALPALRKLTINGNIPPILHHVRGVKDLTPVWRKECCIVSCRRSKPRRKTAWRMRWRATTGAR